MRGMRLMSAATEGVHGGGDSGYSRVSPIRISEIFYSIQGEGVLAGIPSVFVRLSGCNLRCVWCDTPYTSWHPEGREMSIDEIEAAVRGYGATHAVLTGGEPMIFSESIELTQRL